MKPNFYIPFFFIHIFNKGTAELAGQGLGVDILY